MKRIFVVFATAVIGLIALFTLVQAGSTATLTADSEVGTLQQDLLGAGNEDMSAITAPAPVLYRNASVNNILTLDPQVADDTISITYIENLFVNLTNFDLETGDVVPEAATNWEISPDARIYTFTLRADIPWVYHNPATGETAQVLSDQNVPRFVTAADFQYAVYRLCNPNTNSYYAWVIGAAIEGCTDVLEYPDPATIPPELFEAIGVQALTPNTLVIELAQPAAYFLQQTTMWSLAAVPEWTITAYGNEWTNEGNIVTNGRYILHYWHNNGDRSLWRNPFFPADLQGNGNIDQIEVQMVGSNDEIYQRWLNNQVDISGIPPDQFSTHMQNYADETDLINDLSVFYFGFRMTKPPFDNVHVRRAFSAAFDRQTYIDDVRGGWGQPMKHLAPPGIFGAPPIDQVGVGYDVTFAQNELAVAGYPNCQGLPMVEILGYSGTSTQNWLDFAQQQWVDNLGCDPTVISYTLVSFSDLLSRTSAATPDEQAPHMFTLGWGPDYPDENNWVGDLLSCQMDNRFKRTCNTIDDQIAQAATATDPATRIDLYYQIEDAFFGTTGEFPIAPLFVSSRYIARHSWLTRTPALFGGEQWYQWHITPTIQFVDGSGGTDADACTDPTQPCQTIQYALDNANNNSTILIAQGTYTENLYIDKRVTLRGGYEATNWEYDPFTYETIVNGGGTDRVFVIHGNDSSLANLTITGGSTPVDQCWGAGVWISNGDVTIESSKIVENHAGCSGGGIEVNNDLGNASLTLVDSVVMNNSTGDSGGGVSLWRTAATMSNVLIVNNSTPNGGSGLRVEDSDLVLVNSTVSANQDGLGLEAYDTFGSLQTTEIQNSIIWGNPAGDLTCDLAICTVTFSDIGGGWAGAGNIDANPHFVDPLNDDYHLQAWSPAIDAGTTTNAPTHDFEGDARPQNTGIDMGADEFVGTPIINEGDRYVAVNGSDDGSNLCLAPDSPCQTISQAIDMANGGESIFVAQGTYTENLVINKPLTLEGGYEAAGWTRNLSVYETTIDGSNSHTFIGDWDGNNIRYPMVITDGVELKMWYNSGAGGGSIGLATSADGIGWTRHGQNPVLESDPESWDNRLEAPYIIKENDTSYRMWYSGFSDDGSCSIGLATSSNGLDWSKHPNNPILSPGDETWNNVCVLHPSLLFENGIYKMWAMSTGNDDNGETPHIIYITSTNGIDWDWANAEVVLTLEGEDWMWRPYVLHHNGDYQMWFSTWQDNTPRISYATSPDETSWVRYPNNPVLNGTDGEWDDGYATDPFVMYDGSVYSLWYDNEEDIGLATSTNGITWTKHISNPVFERGTPSVWGDPVINVMYNNHGLVLNGLTITGGDGYVAGGIHTDNSNVTIQNCYIHDNQAHGDNWWSGGGVLGNGVLTIEDSVIANNHTHTNGASGVRVGEGTLNMVNTMVVGNSGDDALHLNGGGTFVNVTIADNAIDVGRPGVNHNPQNGEVLTITNSIIAGNGNGAGDAIHNTDFVDVSYSYIDGGWSGVGNIDTNTHPNPGFVNAAGGDYHLAQESVCMDAGTAVYAPDHDFEGDFRPIFNGIDMGADEVSVYTADIPASSGGQITMTDNVTMTVPAGAFGEDVVIEYSPQQNADTGELVGAGVFYELTAVYASNGQPAALEPDYTYTITVPYDEANLPPEIDEADLLLFYFDGTDWQPEPTSQVDTAANLITATPNHFSLWGALEKSDYMIYLPVIIRP